MSCSFCPAAVLDDSAYQNCQENGEVAHLWQLSKENQRVKDDGHGLKTRHHTPYVMVKKCYMCCGHAMLAIIDPYPPTRYMIQLFTTAIFQWEIQDPKMEVLYHIRPYFLGIIIPLHRPYIGLIYMVGTSNLGSWNGHWILGLTHMSRVPASHHRKPIKSHDCKDPQSQKRMPGHHHSNQME